MKWRKKSYEEINLVMKPNTDLLIFFSYSFRLMQIKVIAKWPCGDFRMSFETKSQQKIAYEPRNMLEAYAGLKPISKFQLFLKI